MPSVQKSIFDPQSLDDAFLTLRQHIPQGRAWGSGDNSPVMQSLVRAMARPFQIAQEYIKKLADEYEIPQTTDLIEEWEESVGIPDQCLFSEDTLGNRRMQVLNRISKQPIQSLSDMQTFVDNNFGENMVVLRSGSEYFGSYEYNYEINYRGDFNDRFVIVAEVPLSAGFEYDYEYTYQGGVDEERLRCIIEQFLPANQVLLIKNTTQ